MKKKKAIASLLIGALTIGVFANTASADRSYATEAIKAEQQQVQQQIDNLEGQSDSLQSEISNLDSELVSLLASIDTLEGQIADNEEQIQNTETELVYAEQAIDDQYADMKVRIRYMYETGETSALAMLLESGSIGDFLNRVEYVTSVYDYDRELLNTYTATQYEIKQMKLNLESAKVDLEAKKSELTAKQASLDSLIESKKGELQNFESQIAAAKEEAARLAEEYRRQEIIEAVQRAQAEAAAREEAARREREAAAKKAAEEQARAAAAAAATNTAKSTSANTNANNSSNTSSTSNASEKTTTGNTQTTAEVSVNPEPQTNISGGSVIAYAQQFVGGPYVWGGNSLTNGCDCSGFVVQIYKHFGINLSGSRHSSALRSVGRAVSIENIQPGDIVCYSGHVALYAGGGVIIEAQDSKHGITCSRSVYNAKILAIRRVI